MSREIPDVGLSRGDSCPVCHLPKAWAEEAFAIKRRDIRRWKQKIILSMISMAVYRIWIGWKSTFRSFIQRHWFGSSISKTLSSPRPCAAPTTIISRSNAAKRPKGWVELPWCRSKIRSQPSKRPGARCKSSGSMASSFRASSAILRCMPRNSFRSSRPWMSSMLRSDFTPWPACTIPRGPTASRIFSRPTWPRCRFRWWWRWCRWSARDC